MKTVMEHNTGKAIKQQVMSIALFQIGICGLSSLNRNFTFGAGWFCEFMPCAAGIGGKWSGIPYGRVRGLRTVDRPREPWARARVPKK
jgi:hypothetical protein